MPRHKVEKAVAPAKAQVIEEPRHEEKKAQAPEARVLTPHQQLVEDSRKALSQPLSPGQRFFEAPDGMIMIGEDHVGQMWYRLGNNGKGVWINPRRG